MSTTVLTQTDWRDSVATSISSPEARQGATTHNSQVVLRLVSCYDSVTFDFSDWAPEHLNENTTSFFWGLHKGSLKISCYNLSDGDSADDVHATSLTADGKHSESGKTIIYIHDWCVRQAQAEHGYVPGQRFFRFEKGRYASSLPFPGLKVMQTAIKDFLSSVRGT